MLGGSYIKEYNVVKGKVKVVDLNLNQLVGYYLSEYPNDPLGMLNEDLVNFEIPNVLGQQARLIISIIRGK